MNARALLALAGWLLVGASFGVVWALTVGGLPPWWLTAAVGLGTWLAVEVGGRARTVRRGKRGLR